MVPHPTGHKFATDLRTKTWRVLGPHLTNQRPRRYKRGKERLVIEERLAPGKGWPLLLLRRVQHYSARFGTSSPPSLVRATEEDAGAAQPVLRTRSPTAGAKDILKGTSEKTKAISLARSKRRPVFPPKSLDTEQGEC